MCFVIHKDFSKKQVATEDIIVFKSLRNGLTSEHQGYTYTVNEVNPTVKIKPNNDDINDGYHSWKFPHVGCYKFIIPKGSEYYFSPYQSMQYVSNTIVLASETPLTQEECIEFCQLPKSYKEACEKLNIPEIDENKLIECGLNESDIALKKLETVIKSINTQYGIDKYDWDDSNQYKWAGWFVRGSSFRFSVTYCQSTYAYAGCASRLHLPFMFAVNYVYDINEEFKEYWKTYMN